MTIMNERDDYDTFDDEVSVLIEFYKDKSSTKWQRLGSCRDEDPKIFFPVERIALEVDSDGTVNEVEIEPNYPTDEAKSICTFCPVRDICLSWALEHRVNGTWGGTTEYQRTQLLRRHARKHCPGCTSDKIATSGTGAEQICLSCGVSWPA